MICILLKYEKVECLGIAFLCKKFSFSFCREKSNARKMGKKGSWFAAIKKVFVSHSKDKPTNVSYIINFRKMI